MLSEAHKVAIRHLTPPEADRQMTKKALAELLGITPRAIEKWYTDNPEYKAALDKSREQYASDPDYFDRIARHAVMEGFLAGAMADAKTRDEINHKRACMKEVLEQTKHLIGGEDRVDFTTYTDDELLRMAISGDVDVTGYTKADLEAALEVAR
jgi:hypothetical protein